MIDVLNYFGGGLLKLERLVFRNKCVVFQGLIMHQKVTHICYINYRNIQDKNLFIVLKLLVVFE